MQIHAKIGQNTPLDVLLTLEEVAVYLRLSKDTVYRMAQAGKIPACKVGMQWRFRRTEVERWLEEHRNAQSNIPTRTRRSKR